MNTTKRALLKRRIRLLLFILLNFLNILYSHQTESAPRFKHISLEQGLSQSTVNSIYQDNPGVYVVWNRGWSKLV